MRSFRRPDERQRSAGVVEVREARREFITVLTGVNISSEQIRLFSGGGQREQKRAAVA
jgi:hypothetical protein